MSKYDPLNKFLGNQGDQPLVIYFSQIEELGIQLPLSAQEYDAWWLDRSEGTSHVQSRAWLNDGRQVLKVDRRQQKVWFSERSHPK